MKINKFFKIYQIIFFVLVSYIIFKSELIFKGQNREYYFFYLIVSIFFFFFSFITLFLNEEKNKNFFLVFVSIIFISYIIEISIFSLNQYIGYKKLNYKIKSYKDKTGLTFDIRSKFEVYNEKKKLGRYFPKVHPSDFYIDKKLNILPLSNISFSNSINCNENGYFFISKNDKFGFNNPKGTWDEINYNFILIGDSFVRGECVNRPFDISSVLRQSDFNLKVLNLGQAGSGPLSQFAILREYSKKNSTEKLLWFFYEENDFQDLENEKKSKILINYIKDENFSQNLTSHQDLLDEIIINKINNIIYQKNSKIINNQYESFVRIVKLYNLRFLLINFFKKKNYYEYSHNLELFNEILKKVKKISETKKSELVFIYLPGYNRFNIKNEKYKNYIKKMNKDVIDLVNELNIRVIDFSEDFENMPNPNIFFPFELDGHYNEKGYKFISHKILQYLDYKS